MNEEGPFAPERRAGSDAPYLHNPWFFRPGELERTRHPDQSAWQRGLYRLGFGEPFAEFLSGTEHTVTQGPKEHVATDRCVSISLPFLNRSKAVHELASFFTQHGSMRIAELKILVANAFAVHDRFGAGIATGGASRFSKQHSRCWSECRKFWRRNCLLE